MRIAINDAEVGGAPHHHLQDDYFYVKFDKKSSSMMLHSQKEALLSVAEKEPRKGPEKGTIST